MIPRRKFLTAIGGAAAAAALPFAGPRAARSALPGVLAPLPFEMEQGVKTFHLRSRQVSLPLLERRRPAIAALALRRSAAAGDPRHAGRAGAHPLHQRSAHRAFQHPLAWHPRAQCHGWRALHHPEADPARQRLCLRIHAAGRRHLLLPSPLQRSRHRWGRGSPASSSSMAMQAAPFDDDIVLAAKDWRLAPDGSFLPFSTDQGRQPRRHLRHGPHGQWRRALSRAPFRRRPISACACSIWIRRG